MKTKELSTHVCPFMKKCETLELLYPPHKKYSKLRRKFHESILVSEKNGRKCFTPQGNAGYIYQKEKQLTQDFYIIHPHSKFCECWQMFAIFEYCLGFVIRSFLVSRFPEYINLVRYQIPSLLADLFETADAWLRFNIGYMDKEMQEVVLESRKIVIKTLKSYNFYVDAIVSFPWEFSVYLYSTLRGPPHPVFNFCVLFKIAKVITICRYIMHMAKIYNWSDLSLRIAWMLFYNFVVIHCISCAFKLILTDSFVDPVFRVSGSNNSTSYYYSRIYYVVTYIFFDHEGVGDGVRIDSFKAKLFYSVMLIVLNFNFIVFIAMLLHLLAFTRNTKILFDEMKQEVQKFLARENLPKSTHVRAIKYLEFRYSHSYFNEEMILSSLSFPLKREVMKFLCFNLIKRPNSIFNSVPDELATDLCLLMKLEYFLPGDTVFKVGRKSKKMYFLYSGSVAVYSPEGKEIMHWYEGQQFGMSAFLENPVHPVTAIALEMTELYLLRHRDFVDQLQDYPEHIEKVTQVAREKVKIVTDLITGTEGKDQES